MKEKEKKAYGTWKPAVFFLILLLLVLAFSECFGRLAVKLSNTDVLGRDNIQVELHQQRKNSIDVLVLGDSESYTSFSPIQFYEATGSTAFVAAQSGQKTSEAVSLLATAFDSQKPKAVLLETNELFRYRKSWEAVRDHIYQGAGQLFPLFRYHNLWKAGVGSDPALPGTTYFGFTIRKGKKAYVGTKEYMRPTDAEAFIPDSIREDFNQIRTACKECGIPLILYSAPSPVNYNMSKHNAVATLAAKYDLPYVDLNLKQTELGIDWSSDTLDAGDHLNYYGAVKTTAWLTSYLQKRISLTDRRQDSAYSDWSGAAAKYDQEIQR